MPVSSVSKIRGHVLLFEYHIIGFGESIQRMGLNPTDVDMTQQHARELFVEMRLDLVQRVSERVLNELILLFYAVVLNSSISQVAAWSRIWHEHELNDVAIFVGESQSPRLRGDVKAASRVCAIDSPAPWRYQIQRVTQGPEESLVIVVSTDADNCPTPEEERLKDVFELGDGDLFLLRVAAFEEVSSHKHHIHLIRFQVMGDLFQRAADIFAAVLKPEPIVHVPV